MALFVTPEEHAANPPETWVVTKAGPARWQLRTAPGAVLSTFPRKRDAEQERRDGFFVRLYEQERRWFAGEPVRGWKPYAPA